MNRSNSFESTPPAEVYESGVHPAQLADLRGRGEGDWVEAGQGEDVLPYVQGRHTFSKACQ